MYGPTCAVEGFSGEVVVDRILNTSDKLVGGGERGDTDSSYSAFSLLGLCFFTDKASGTEKVEKATR